jgi:hypothetical protein
MSVDSVARGFVNRQAKAVELFRSGAVSEMSRPGRYFVKSQSGSGGYAVDLLAQKCDCPDNTERGYDCKHLMAARMANAALHDERVALQRRVNARIAASKAAW